MAIKKTHPHATFIFEWTQDTSRKIQTRERGVNPRFPWQNVPINFVLQDIEGEFEFRFAPQKPNIVSSLTDEELLAIAEANNPNQKDINYSTVRATANAAAQRAIEDLKVSEDWLEENFLSPRAALLAKQAIMAYLTALREGRLAYRPSRLTPYC